MKLGICMLMTMMAFILAIPVEGASMKCTGVDVTVIYENDVDALTACTGATEAIVFMTEHGFNARIPITISVVDQIEKKHTAQVLGQYSSKTTDITMLSFSSCLEKSADNPPFGIAMNMDIHRSFVVHEIAHAIADHNFVIDNPSRVAQEYIAYTVQLATMLPSLRDDILSRNRTGGFESEEEITDLFYAFNPNNFAVKSYLHFLRPENGSKFFQRILTGSFQPTEDELYLMMTSPRSNEGAMCLSLEFHKSDPR